MTDEEYRKVKKRILKKDIAYLFRILISLVILALLIWLPLKFAPFKLFKDIRYPAVLFIVILDKLIIKSVIELYERYIKKL